MRGSGGESFAPFLNQKRSYRDGESQNQKTAVANQRGGAQLFIISKAAAINFESKNFGARHRADEQKQKAAGYCADYAQTNPRDQKYSQHELKPRQDLRHQLHGGNGQHLVGIDGHGEEELVVAQVPFAREMKF